MCGHGFIVHHPETLQDLLLYIFLNRRKYLSGDYHTTNHKNHKKILGYISHLPSEYEYYACLLITEDTSTNFTGSLGVSEYSYSLSPSGCENHNLGPPSQRIHAHICLDIFLTHECK